MCSQSENFWHGLISKRHGVLRCARQAAPVPFFVAKSKQQCTVVADCCADTLQQQQPPALSRKHFAPAGTGQHYCENARSPGGGGVLVCLMSLIRLPPQAAGCDSVLTPVWA